MATSSGFFDSINGDRRYTAVDMGHIMDYLVTDGVYSYYPETGVVYDDKHSRNRTIPPFQVSAVEGPDSWKNPSGYAVAVGPGRAWFDHTWTLVTTPEIVPLSAPDPTGDKIDCVVLQMNKSESVRANRFVVIESKMPFDGANAESIDGHPPTNYQSKLPLVPRPPEVIAAMGIEDEFATYGTYNQLKNYFPDLQGHYMHDDEVHDVPIAYIYRPVGATSINDYQIFSAVGTSDCPFVAAVGDGAMSFEHLYLNWSSQFDDFLKGYINKVSEEYTAWQANLLAVEPEWNYFLDKKSAEFMQYLKMFDRIWHVWYQGAVNFTYEMLRKHQVELEDFEARWEEAVHRAEEIMENGLTEYMGKIDELLKKMENIDQTVQDAIKAAEEQMAGDLDGLVDAAVDKRIEELKTDIVSEFSTTIEQLLHDKVGGFLQHRGSYPYSDLPEPGEDTLGGVYNVMDEFTTDGRFLEGADKTCPAGTDVVVVKDGDEYKYDIIGGGGGATSGGTKPSPEDPDPSPLEDPEAAEMQTLVDTVDEKLYALRVNLEADYLQATGVAAAASAYSTRYEPVAVMAIEPPVVKDPFENAPQLKAKDTTGEVALVVGSFEDMETGCLSVYNQLQTSYLEKSPKGGELPTYEPLVLDGESTYDTIKDKMAEAADWVDDVSAKAKEWFLEKSGTGGGGGGGTEDSGFDTTELDQTVTSMGVKMDAIEDTLDDYLYTGDLATSSYVAPQDPLVLAPKLQGQDKDGKLKALLLKFLPIEDRIITLQSNVDKFYLEIEPSQATVTSYKRLTIEASTTFEQIKSKVNVASAWVTSMETAMPKMYLQEDKE